MGRLSDFDIESLGKTFDFEKDLAFGQNGEKSIIEFAKAIGSGAVEVKTDRYKNGKMVVETHQSPGNRKDIDGKNIWVPSGLNVTKAEWWVYIYSVDQSFVMFKVDRLKRYLRAHPEVYNNSTKRTMAPNSDNPALAWIVEKNDVINMISSAQYD
jgi:hypothetical protein